MQTGKRICKHCGAEYEFCYVNPNSNYFRWQDVACCEEHGAKYLEAVLIARGELTKKEETGSNDNTSLKEHAVPKRKRKGAE